MDMHRETRQYSVSQQNRSLTGKISGQCRITKEVILTMFLLFIICPVFFASCTQKDETTLPSESLQSSLGERDEHQGEDTTGENTTAEGTTEEIVKGTSDDAEESDPTGQSAAEEQTEYTVNTAAYPEEDCYKGWDPGYAFRYTEGSRERIWEEDVVEFANTLLSPYDGHIYLTDREFVISTFEITRNIKPQSMNKFNPEKQRRFLSFINHILREIPRRDDEFISYMIQEAISGIGDVHTGIMFKQRKESYPFHFEILEDAAGNLGVYCTATIQEYEGALGKKLLSVNHLDLDEIVRRFERIRAYENEHLHESDIFTRGQLKYGILKYLDIVDAEEAVFAFEDGTEIRALPVEQNIKTPDKDSDGAAPLQIVELWKDADRITDEKGDTLAYWYRIMEEDKIIYARIKSFRYFPEYEIEMEELSTNGAYLKWDEEHQNIFEFLEELARQCIEKGADYKLVFDLRFNPGGYPFPDLKSLRRFREAGNQIYIFIDEGSASCSCFAAYGIDEFVPNTVIVGSPSAQPVNFPLGHFPRMKFRLAELSYFRYSNKFIYLDGNNTDDAILPDVMMYQRYDDFIRHIDTFYEWVKNQ
ncbi:MAG: hypothetical protein Q4A41_02460 [Bacillota bacterium]|nr:hypothetical protein [Bacillota bacterium]